jgi:hypothetical protein
VAGPFRKSRDLPQNLPSEISFLDRDGSFVSWFRTGKESHESSGEPANGVIVANVYQVRVDPCVKFWLLESLCGISRSASVIEWKATDIRHEAAGYVCRYVRTLATLL